MAIQKLSSRIDSVKIYAAGATVTRIAELQLIPGELPEQVEIAQLPLALEDSSVRVRVETIQGNVPIAGDIRIGLAVPPPSETPNPPPEEELRAAKIAVKQIEDIIRLIDREISVLNQLEVPARPESDIGLAPPASPMSARLALANFSDEQIRLRIQEKRENLEKLAKAKENLADLEQKQAIASRARNAKPEELRKTVIVSLSYENETSDLNQTIGLILEYFVPGARWTPTYVCRLNSVENQATIAVRALICQRTGEDWSSVKLELSTANPIFWCAIPELPSLRLGKAQPEIRKAGWRKPPVGAEILFEDFDRQKESALADVRKYSRRLMSGYSSDLLSGSGKSERRAYRVADEELSGQGFLESSESQDLQFLSDELLDKEEMVDFSELESLVSESTSLQRLSARPTPASALEPLSARLTPASAAPAPSMARRSSKYDLESRNFPKVGSQDEFKTDFLPYGLMRMGTADNREKRGKLAIAQTQELYLEILHQQKVVVNFNILEVVQQAVYSAQECLTFPLPPGGINVRKVAASFDYSYSADGRIDIPSDGQFHSVALTSKTTDVDVRYIVVPREDTNVFRIAQLRNPLSAPLLSGPADVYVDGEYILSTNIVTVPPQGQMELGLGVEQAIKVARNTSYWEVRSGETIVAFNELCHQIKIEIANRLKRNAKIEVRERLPIPEEGAKVEVKIEQVSPEWQQYKQEERGTPIKGGYLWQIEVPAKEQTTLSVDYKIKTFVDSELIGGNRRE
ncbi:DUF4139 domain-containing protein [Floridanema aerugineum]|uniref:DUF4139 domain-containing protein n=1 Tax=Floridaenema aerugineum BLCC-F46 TaxID=3153654 RepID=A0ABV4XGX1_9CYAN